MKFAPDLTMSARKNTLGTDVPGLEWSVVVMDNDRDGWFP